MSDDTKTFDPAKHMSKVQGRDYLEVKWRLVWLRSVQPEAQIKTEMVQHQHNSAVFRAEVTLPSGASATGWKQEASDDFGDYLEKAETGALGRALAALGFGTQFTDDYTDGGGFQRPAEVGGERQQRPARGNSGGGPRLITPSQVKFIRDLLASTNRSEDDLCARYQVQALEQLSAPSASEIIDQLKAERKPRAINSQRVDRSTGEVQDDPDFDDVPF